ncbi:MAG: hypothetical protein ACJ8J3_23075, partial [Burkholderia ambifaria]
NLTQFLGDISWMSGSRHARTGGDGVDWRRNPPESVARHLPDVSPHGLAACASPRHVSCLHQSVEYDRESRQPFDTPDPKSVGGRAASGRADPAC